MSPEHQRNAPARIGADTEPRAECPRCRQRALRDASFGGAAVLRCSRCVGHWVPRASAPTLRRAFPSVGALDRKALDEVKRAASVRNLHDGVRYLACPFCGERMDRRQFALGSGIVIDRCLNDGVWFDGGELELARAYFAAGGPHEEVARKRREARDGGSPIPTNPAGGAVPSPMVELLLWLMT